MMWNLIVMLTSNVVTYTFLRKVINHWPTNVVYLTEEVS